MELTVPVPGGEVWAQDAGGDGTPVVQFRGAVASWFAIGDLVRADPPVFGRLGEVRVPAVTLAGVSSTPW